MKNEHMADNKAEQVAGFVKKAGRAANTYQLANAFIMLLVLLVFAGGFAYIGVPWYICIGIVVVALLFFVLSIIRYLRISAAVSDKTGTEETTAETADISLDPGEFLVDTIPAVMRYGETRSIEVLGTGRILTPENALIITNKAVWAITVPMPGQHK